MESASMRVKRMTKEQGERVNIARVAVSLAVAYRLRRHTLQADCQPSGGPNFHVSGSIRGMREKYYGYDALLVRCGAYIYNVTSEPRIYNQATI